MGNETGMQLNEFKTLLRKCINEPNLLADMDTIGAFFPTGGIIMWSGTEIPDGWYLCDGTNGTPDLEDKFILGASSGFGNLNISEGSRPLILSDHIGQIHSVTQPNSHTSGAISAILSVHSTTVTDDGTAQVTAVDSVSVVNGLSHTGTAVDQHSDLTHSVIQAPLPAYYVLAFIQKA